MAYDEARGVTVLFGGRNNSSSHNETWEYKDKVWTKRESLGATPPARFNHAMTYDSRRGVVVLFGAFQPKMASLCFRTFGMGWLILDRAHRSRRLAAGSRKARHGL